MGVLRLLLAISVLVAHSAPLFGFQLVGGEIAVQSFFMISGFYMALVLNGKYGPGSYGLFIGNRLLRLFPVYWVVLLLTVAGSYAALVYTGHPLKLDAWLNEGPHLDVAGWAELLWTNVFIVGQDVTLFEGLNPATGHLYFTPDFNHAAVQVWPLLFVHQAWSLSLEIVFYLLAPALLRRRTGWLVALVLLSLALRLALWHAGYSTDPWSYRFFPTELAFFLAGALAFRAYGWVSQQHWPTELLLAVFVGIVALTLAYGWLPGGLSKRLFYYACFVTALPFVFHLTKRHRLDARVGELSYPVYIAHILILLFMPALLHALHLSAAWNVPLFVALTLVFAAMLVRAVVEPMERVRQWRVRKQQKQEKTEAH